LSLNGGTDCALAGTICLSMEDRGSASDVSTTAPFCFLGQNADILSSLEQFALLEAQFIVARMVQTFESLQSLDNEEWQELYTLSMTSKNGVHVRLEKAVV
jgi:hypothetical protein